MTSSRRHQNWIFEISLRAATAALAIAFVLTAVATRSAQAQTFTVIHTFTQGADGGNPGDGFTIDRGGTLWGTTQTGGVGQNGTVFKMSKKGTDWIFSPLYKFAVGSDGNDPVGRVIFGPNGTLYGTTQTGGGIGCLSYGCGTVFNLRPSPTAPATPLSPWIETVLHRFSGNPDGAFPWSAVVFDQKGNLYGTTPYGGSSNQGAVFKLKPQGGWSLYSFSGPPEIGRASCRERV